MNFKRPKRYAGGALGDITKAISDVMASLERLRADPPIFLRNENNSACIYTTGGYGGESVTSGASVYSSYFRVVDASGLEDCKIGVTNGNALYSGSGNCGAVKINGEYVEVAVHSEEVSADGWVWLHSWISSANGAEAEIIVTETDDPPDNPNGGLAFSNQLIGRFTCSGGEITSITQDYLRGGEHTEILFGDCEGEAFP